MNALKWKNVQGNNRCQSGRGMSLVVGLLPANLQGELTGRQLGQLATILEATYLDGYEAAGGNTADTIDHVECHRKAALDKLARFMPEPVPEEAVR